MYFQTFKDKHMMKISAICDPDSSSDEDDRSRKHNKKSVIKSTRLTSPKPVKVYSLNVLKCFYYVESYYLLLLHL